MKIVVLGGLDSSLLNFRGPLLRTLVAAGHDVLGVAPAQTTAIREKLAGIGVRFVPIELARAGLNPATDWRSKRSLEKLFRAEKPDVILAYTIKPVIYGITAAWRTGVPQRYALITGLGAAFNTLGLRGWMLRKLATWLYRRSLRRCTRVIAQNQDIADYFVRHSIVGDRARLLVVAGSGVDTSYFTASPLPMGSPVFLLLARMLRDKGVEEYVAAARMVKRKLPEARFLLVGDTDPNPAAISAEKLAQWDKEKVVEYQPAASDVRPLLALCSVYVLPSYHEGMPRSVLEAMATGRPVITTDTMGCRETVINPGPTDHEGIRVGDNGLLVPVRGVEPLVAAMSRLALDNVLCERMGRRGREIATQQFDVRKINDVMLRAMDLLPPVEHALHGTSSA